MPITFHAPIVDISEENGGTLIAFAEGNPSDETPYLIIHCKDSFSEDDIRVGMDDVYLETCGQGWSWYGHIRSVESARNRLRVQLDAEAAAEMGDTGAIEVTFDLADSSFENLRTALRRVFKQRGYYSERSA
jgi:hypothetical protein